MKFNVAMRISLPLFISTILISCSSRPADNINPRADVALAMFRDRCQGAGEKIYKTVKDIDGIFLINLRPNNVDFSSQYELQDPYGRDLQGEGYIETFLRGSYQNNHTLPKVLPSDFPAHSGYAYVEAIDPIDGKRYRYTGRVDRPGLSDKKYSLDATRFVIQRSLAESAPPAYGVIYADISTREERSHWIAGSSLKVVDLKSSEVIAERIGYMVDIAQGNISGGRIPWLWAANHSCPSFGTVNAFSSQPYQTETFVEKVLKPSKGK